MDWTYYRLALRAFFPAAEQISISQKSALHLQVREEILSKASIFLENLAFDASLKVAQLLEQNEYFADEYSRFLEQLNNGTLFLRDNFIVSDMLIPLRGQNSLLQHVPAPWQQLRYQILQPLEIPGSAYQSTRAQGEYLQTDVLAYSGLVIDAREFSLQPAILPRIYNQDGFLIYGPEYLSQEIGMERGIVGYVQSYSDPEVQHRAGMNAYFTVPMAVKGKYNTDIVLSNRDAEKILGQKESTTNLRKARVIVILP